MHKFRKVKGKEDTYLVGIELTYEELCHIWHRLNVSPRRFMEAYEDQMAEDYPYPENLSSSIWAMFNDVLEEITEEDTSDET